MTEELRSSRTNPEPAPQNPEQPGEEEKEESAILTFFIVYKVLVQLYEYSSNPFTFNL